MTNPRQAIVPAFLAAALLLGGASMAGLLANLLLQWLALGLAAWALLAAPPVTLLPDGRRLLLFAGLLAALFLLQLVPLPPALWTALPGRGEIVEGFRLLRLPLPWLPVSLTPRNTLMGLLWLLPALAAGLAVVRQGAFHGRRVAWVVVAGVVVTVLLGALQLAGGDRSPWYLYAKTNRDTAVGLFANPNHTADFLNCSIPFLAALRTDLARRSESVRARSSVTVMLAIVFALVVVGLLLNFSLAGFVLFVPATLAAVLLMRTGGGEGGRARGVPRWGVPALAVLTLAAVAAIFVGPFGNNLVGTEQATQKNSRATNFAVSARAAVDYLPLGSGVGTYQTVYREREDPLAVDRTFRNHTHNDYIETVLEAGLPALLLILLFLAWWGRETVGVWRDAAGSSPYAKAATIATAVLLAHSTVDYPLRTASLSTLFAICCAMLVQRPAARSGCDREAGWARHLSA